MFSASEHAKSSANTVFGASQRVKTAYWPTILDEIVGQYSVWCVESAQKCVFYCAFASEHLQVVKGAPGSDLESILGLFDVLWGAILI